MLELLEVQELELARGILRSTPAMLAMKQVTAIMHPLIQFYHML